MQTPTSVPASLPVATVSWLDAVPSWLIFSVGFLVIGMGSCVLTSQLRAAIPAPTDAKWRILHYLYPSLFGMAFATAAYPALPGLGIETRWLVGLVAPYLWVPVYEILKKRYETQLGVPLPGAGAIVAGATPQPAAPPQTNTGG